MNPADWDAPWALITVALFGIVMARANATYWVGRGLSAGAARSRHSTIVASAGYQQAARWIDRWGAPVVSVSFLTVGLQTLINLAAGAGRMKLRHYLPAVTVGCIIWALVYSTVGFVSWRAFSALYRSSPPLAFAVMAVLAATVITLVVVGLRRRDSEGGRDTDLASEQPLELVEVEPAKSSPR